MTHAIIAVPKYVRFSSKITSYDDNLASTIIVVTYESDTGSHYLSKANWKKVYLPILCHSMKRMGVRRRERYDKLQQAHLQTSHPRAL